MRIVVKIAGIAAAIIVVVVGVPIAIFLIRGGVLDEITENIPADCRVIPIADGSAEDIAVDRANGIAYLSILNRRGLAQGQAVEGTILQLDLKELETGPRPALRKTPVGFRPHGLSLIELDDGKKRLFVINHENGENEQIEIFEMGQTSSSFSHVETLTDPLVTHPNDLVAVGPRNFYIANDSGADNGVERVAEMVFAVGLSPLVYFNGESFSVIDNDLRSSGGINVNLSTNRLYVGETIGEAIRIYELNQDGSVAGRVFEILLDGAVDNIDVDDQGHLWVANHINTLSLVRHFGDENFPAPTQVQHIILEDNERPRIETIVEHSGENFSAASVGVTYKNQLIIGSITEPGLMICDL